MEMSVVNQYIQYPNYVIFRKEFNSISMFFIRQSLVCLVALNLMPIKTFIALALGKNNNKIIYGAKKKNTDGEVLGWQF